MNFVIHKGTSDPVSAQIGRQIERAIRGGEFLPGERLPSVGKLKRELGVAYSTVLRAYADLMKAGFVYSVPSTGVFVAHHAPPRTERRLSLDLLKRGIYDTPLVGTREAPREHARP
ncbi:MAG: GntR family transcriptional regulator [Planctomycetota bacterium]|jgi:DNA-binding transcriptional regulator YhcF (GntR family)